MDEESVSWAALKLCSIASEQC